ncbi:MAG: hypothetical protein V1661_01575 [bacterium]
MKNNKLKKYTLGFFIAAMFLPFFNVPAASAADALSLTITPPFFQLTIGPGEFWASNIKITNSNPYDLTLYASVMNFKAEGEGGQGQFFPVAENEAGKGSLARWVEVTKEPILVPKGQSIEMPFSVRIPADAEPGGYYAAILIGTQPGQYESKGPVVKVASMVSSLLFVRIKGAVREDGFIREFIAEKSFYQKPQVDFKLRFENIGNVHLKPQGEVVIYNMWGKEKGKISLNQDSEFGNVLPQTTREFNFSWDGEEGLFEIGRYKALAVLTFGQEAKQNVSYITYFWIIPVKPLLWALGILIALVLLVVISIKVYVKKTVRSVRNEIAPEKKKKTKTISKKPKV